MPRCWKGSLLPEPLPHLRFHRCAKIGGRGFPKALHPAPHSYHPARYVDRGSLRGELAGDLGDDVQRNNAEDENKRQNQDNDGVDLESGGLVGVEAEHGAARASSAGGARAAWSRIGDLLLLIGGRTATDHVAGSSGGGRGRSACGAGASRRADGGGGSWGRHCV